MPIIRSVRLEAESRSGGKFYEIDIFEDPPALGGALESQRFRVNFRFAAIGSPPRTGTKTTNPVSLGAAEVIFQRLIDDKMYGPSRYREVHVVTEAFRRDLRAADEQRARSIAKAEVEHGRRQRGIDPFPTEDFSAPAITRRREPARPIVDPDIQRDLERVLEEGREINQIVDEAFRRIPVPAPSRPQPPGGPLNTNAQLHAFNRRGERVRVTVPENEPRMPVAPPRPAPAPVAAKPAAPAPPPAKTAEDILARMRGGRRIRVIAPDEK